MTNPLEAIAKKLRGHPCEKSIKQTGHEIHLSGVSVGVGDFKIEVGKFSNKIKEFYKVTNVMIALDNSQYRLCTAVFTMGLSESQKQIVNSIRLQIGLGFDQLLAILGSIDETPSEELQKKVEEWVDYLGTLSKRSIDSLSPKISDIDTKMEFMTEGGTHISPEIHKEESLDTILENTMKYQKITKDDLIQALNLMSNT